MNAALGVRPPFRLDLTAGLLRRFTVGAAPDAGGFCCALPSASGMVGVCVTQPAADTIAVSVDPDARISPADFAGLCALVRRMFAIDADLTEFERAAAAFPWLADLVRRTHGVKPASFATLWEAGVNAIVFQSVSMFAADAVLGRLVAQCGAQLACPHGALDVFPSIGAVAAAPDTVLRSAGLSGAKVRSLRALAAAIVTGAVCERKLERRTTPEILTALCTIAGIGPWSAAVIALRRFARLDVFPLRDSGVVRTVAQLAGRSEDPTPELLDAFGDARGMLYHVLLHARISAAGTSSASSGTGTGIDRSASVAAGALRR